MPKKRKVAAANGTASAVAGAGEFNDLKADAELQFYVQDTSFAIPQRKKLRLELTRGTAPGAKEYLRARNQATKEVEFGVPVGKIRECRALSTWFYTAWFY